MGACGPIRLSQPLHQAGVFYHLDGRLVVLRPLVDPESPLGESRHRHRAVDHSAGHRRHVGRVPPARHPALSQPAGAREDLRLVHPLPSHLEHLHPPGHHQPAPDPVTRLHSHGAQAALSPARASTGCANSSPSSAPVSWRLASSSGASSSAPIPSRSNTPNCAPSVTSSPPCSNSSSPSA